MSSWRQLARRLVEPRPGAARRLPAGPYRGIRIEADPGASLDLWFGLWESELAPHIRRLCRPGMRCVEVGSLNALYAMTFAKLCRAPVIAYEPDGDARARCERNLALNPQLARWVELRPVGVGPREGQVTLDQELAGLLSNPLLGERLDRLIRALSRQHQRCGGEPPPALEPRLRPGMILAAIKQVLAAHPDGVRTVEVHALAERSLGRLRPTSTVKARLAGDPDVERIGRGVYRLRENG